MNMLLQIPAQIEKIQTLSDGSIKIVSITQELTPDDMTILFTLRNKLGWLLFKETKINEEYLVKIPEEIKEFKEELSYSQQMRNIIYRIWEKNTDRKKSFPDFYKSYMFQLNEKLKEKLND